MSKFQRFLFFACFGLKSCHGFTLTPASRTSCAVNFNSIQGIPSCQKDMLTLNAVEDPENDEDADVGTMRVAEMKSELNLRGIDYSDCFDRESLSKKLRKARISGKADPTIIDQFNKQSADEVVLNKSLDFDDEIIDKVTGGDGTLPGGMPPDMLKTLVSNPELMTLMQNPKMQDVMKLMMTGGQEVLEKAMEEDREIYEIVTKLNSVMGDAI